MRFVFVTEIGEDGERSGLMVLSCEYSYEDIDCEDEEKKKSFQDRFVRIACR